MTMDGGQPATGAAPSDQSAPPPGLVMRRSRSLSELPGSLRVPIIARRGDGERMRVRLEASREGLEELRMLREQQQQLVDQVKAAASQKRGNITRQSNTRRSSTSIRSSTASLARINEDDPLDTSASLGARDENLRDCTNLPGQGWGDWRGTQTGRSRRPLSLSDSCFLEGALYLENEQGGGGRGGGRGGSSLRKVRSLDSFAHDRSASDGQISRRASTQALSRSASYRDSASSSSGQHRASADFSWTGGSRGPSTLTSPSGSTLSLNRADPSADYANHEAVATFEGKTRKVGRSHSFSVGPGPSSGLAPWLRASPRAQAAPVEPILPTAAMASLCDAENMEPKLRRASLQCEAVLTGSSGRQRDVFRDVDIRCDFPSPLHAVLRQYSGAKGSIPARADLTTPASQSKTSKTRTSPSQTAETLSTGSGATTASGNGGSGISGNNNNNNKSNDNNGNHVSHPATSASVINTSRCEVIQKTTSPPSSLTNTSASNVFPSGVMPSFTVAKTAAVTASITSGTTNAVPTQGMSIEGIPWATPCSQTTANTNATNGSSTSTTAMRSVESCPITSCHNGDNSRKSKPSTKMSGSETGAILASSRMQDDEQSLSDGKRTCVRSGLDSARVRNASENGYLMQDRDAPLTDVQQVTQHTMEAEVPNQNERSRRESSSNYLEERERTSKVVNASTARLPQCDVHPANGQGTDDGHAGLKEESASGLVGTLSYMETPKGKARRLRARSLNEIPESLKTSSYRSEVNGLPSYHDQVGSSRQTLQRDGQQPGTQGSSEHLQEQLAFSGQASGFSSQRKSTPEAHSGASTPLSLPVADVEERGESVSEDRKTISQASHSSDDVFENQSDYPSSPGGAPTKGSHKDIFYPENPDFRIEDWYSVKSSGSFAERSADEVFFEDRLASGCALPRTRASPTFSRYRPGAGETPSHEKQAEETRTNNNVPGLSGDEILASPGDSSCRQLTESPKKRERYLDPTPDEQWENVLALDSSRNGGSDPSCALRAKDELLDPPSASFRSPQVVVDATEPSVATTTNVNLISSHFSSTDNGVTVDVFAACVTSEGSAHDLLNNNNSDGCTDNRERCADFDVSSARVPDARINNNYIGSIPIQTRPPLSSTNPFLPHLRPSTNPFFTQPLSSTNPFVDQPPSSTNPFIQPPFSPRNPFVSQLRCPNNPFSNQPKALRAGEGLSSRKKPNANSPDEGYITSSPETPRGRHWHKHSVLSDSSATSAEMDESPSRGETTPDFAPPCPALLPSAAGSARGDGEQAASGREAFNDNNVEHKTSLPFRQTDL